MGIWIHMCDFYQVTVLFLPLTTPPTVTVVHVIRTSLCCPILESMEITAFVRTKTVEHAFSAEAHRANALQYEVYVCHVTVRSHIQETIQSYTHSVCEMIVCDGDSSFLCLTFALTHGVYCNNQYQSRAMRIEMGCEISALQTIRCHGFCFNITHRKM